MDLIHLNSTFYFIFYFGVSEDFSRTNCEPNQDFMQIGFRHAYFRHEVPGEIFSLHDF